MGGPGGPDFGALPGAALERVARAAGAGPTGRMLGVCRHWARQLAGPGADGLWGRFRAEEGWGPLRGEGGLEGEEGLSERAAFALQAGVRRKWRRGAGALGSVAAHERWTVAVAAQAQGDIVVTGGYDRTVKVWERATLRWTKVLQGHSGKVSCVAAGEGGAVVSAARGIIAHTGAPELLLWDVETGQARDLLGVGLNSNICSAVNDVAFAGPHTVLCGHAGGDAMLWDIRASDACAQVYRGHFGPVFSVAVSQGGALGPADAPEVGTASLDHSAGLWDARTLRRIHALPHEDGVLAVDIGGASRGGVAPVIVTGSMDNMATVWSRAAGTKLSSIAHGDWVRKTKLRGEFLATCAKDGAVGVWDLTDPAAALRTLRWDAHSDARCLAADWTGIWIGCTDGQLHCISFSSAPAFPHSRPWGL